MVIKMEEAVIRTPIASTYSFSSNTEYNHKSFVNFKQFIESKGFKYNDYVLKIIYNSIFKINGNVKGILLTGPAGVGKTSMGELIAEYLNADIVFFQCTYGTGEDDLLYKYVPSEEAKSGIKITLGPIPLALKLSRNKKVVLLIDEFDKTRPSADALLLDVLQNARVSLFLDEKETVIKGKKENLIVIITSNGFREFSEPLIRRVVQVKINPIPAIEVFKLMLRKFPRKIALILTQIYDDTIRAGLIKPATIQELEQLGRILLVEDNVELDKLIRSFVVKYEDDWEKYLMYVRGREPFTWLNRNDNALENENTSIEEFYDTNKLTEEEERLVDELEDTIEKNNEVNNKKIDDTSKNSGENYDNYNENYIERVSKSILPSDLSHYTTAIQLFKPEPSSDPLILSGLGEFKKEYGTFKPIDYKEHRETLLDSLEKTGMLLCNSQLLFKMEFNNVDLNVVSIFDKILYYSKELIRGIVSLSVDDDCKIIIDTAIILKDKQIEVAVRTPCNNCEESKAYAIGSLFIDFMENLITYIER